MARARHAAGERTPLRASGIARDRLANQLIATHPLATPADVVSWLCAVQSQDYAGGKWAIALRLDRATEPAIEQAIAERSIVRTWPMRGTLHFVAAADVRWMLDLLAKRPLARAASRHRQLELDDDTFRRARRVIERALHGGKQITRVDAYSLLDASGVSTAGQRGIHVLAQLAHEGVLVFGAREGKQQTLALLEEWVPPAPSLTRDEALAELARRYFHGHGPATDRDLAWWSGLPLTDARAAIEMATDTLVHERIKDMTYWSGECVEAARSPRGAVLLPPFDEYLVGYSDRSAALDPVDAPKIGAMLRPTIVLDGRVAGTWRRRFERGAVVITLEPFRPLADRSHRAVEAAARAYAAYVGMPLRLADARRE